MSRYLTLGSLLLTALAGFSQATTLNMDCDCCFDYAVGGASPSSGESLKYNTLCSSSGPVQLPAPVAGYTLLSFWGCFDPSQTTASQVIPGCGEQLSINSTLDNVYYRVTDDGDCVWDDKNNIIGCGEAEIVYQGQNQTEPNPYFNGASKIKREFAA